MPEMGTTEPTPDLDALLQEEATVPAVPVRGEGVFLTQTLPARRVQYATDLVGTSWTQVLPASHKRARVTLVADRPVRVSSSSMTGGMYLPAGTPYVARHSRAIAVRCESVFGPYGDPEVVTVANPGAGVGSFSVIVPAGEQWQPLSLRYAVQTSAVVANRFAEVDFRTPAGATIADHSSPTAQAASTSRAYSWFPGGGNPSGSNTTGLPMLEGVTLSPGWTVTGTVFGVDPGDAISEIVLLVRKATIGPAQVGTAVELWAD